MSNIYNFYGNVDDVLKLWRFISNLPGMRFVEVYSRNNVENRWFESFPEEKYEQDGASHVAAWPSLVGGVPRQRIDRLPADSAKKIRASGTFFLESPALIEITTAPSPTDPDYISPRELRYWTEKTARGHSKYCHDDSQNNEVDWLQLKKTTDQIISYIKKTAPLGWNRKPVLPGCAESLKDGSRELWFWGEKSRFKAVREMSKTE